MSLLDVRNLIVDLPTAAGWIRPVNEVSLHLAAGESLGLVGESGSGKTMLALALIGVLPPGARVAGSAVLKRGETNERNLTQLNEKAWRAVRGREIAMVFQEPMTSLNPVMRIGAQIAEGIRAHEPNLGKGSLCVAESEDAGGRNRERAAGDSRAGTLENGAAGTCGCHASARWAR